MKKVLTKHKILFISLTAIIILVAVFIIVKTYAPPLSSDTDTGHYSSSSGYMSYYNQNIFKVSPSKEYSESAKFDNGKPIAVNDDTNKFYLVEGKLYCKDNEGNEFQISNYKIDRYRVFGDNVIYSTQTDCVLYVFSLSDKSCKKIENYDIGPIRWFDLDENNIYIAYVRSDSAEIQSATVVKHDYKSLKKSEEKSFVTQQAIRFFLCSGDIYYNYYRGATYKLNFNEKEDKELFKEYNAENMVSNNDAIFFNIHDYVSTFYKQTTNAESNGLWKYNIKSDTLTKISDECIIDDLLATENYLYCYKINYVFPYGMFDDINLGYKIEQIKLT